ncbi:tetratricopeptide repeat protein [Streptomyces ovatisporus]|uniref:Tetratricopeptide repeat protein n=1 Tax=Streptomyces ovatisporus TaxID=1128682 RepID=A0ABV9A7V7_9ACTN
MRGSLKWPLIGTALVLMVLGAVGGAAGGWFDLVWIAAIAAVAGFIVSTAWEHLQDRRADDGLPDTDPELAVVSEPVTYDRHPAGVPVGTADRVTDALTPARGVVEFIGRSEELRLLHDWCGPGGESARLALVTGAGGVGKTRLALHLAEQLQQQGWRCRRVLDGEDAAVVGVVEASRPGPVLLLVDHAETRPGLPQLLASAVTSDAAGLRVLMLARDEGEWWEHLKAAASPIGPAASGAVTVQLQADPGAGADSRELVARAVPQFARHLELPVPDGVEVEPAPHPVPMLVLHAAALVAVLRSREGAGDGAAPLRVGVGPDVLDELLRHAARSWHDSAAQAGLTGPQELDEATVQHCVAVTSLLAADSEESAAELLRTVPGLGAESRAGLRRRTARWLGSLHPAPVEGAVAPLQPALLAERHVTTRLHESPELAAAIRDRLDVVQALRALTLLTRATAHHPHAAGLLEDWLRRRTADLHGAAITVAIETPGPLGGILAGALAVTDVRPEVLEHIQRAIPYPTAALAEAGIAVTRRIVERLPRGTGPEQRALWLTTLGLQYSRAGQLEEALKPAQEAVALHRELAQDAPERFRPDLAGSLNNLGNVLSELERAEEALEPAQEAAELYRELAQDAPARFRPRLAGSLNNLGNVLSELGRTKEALEPAQEAVAIRRELAQDAPERFRPVLARSLDNLGDRLSELGREEEARSHWQESAALFQESGPQPPDRS